MAASQGGAGELRQRITVMRRPETAGDGGGNFDGDPAAAFSRPARLTPTRGRESVDSGRLQGASSWDCLVRFDSRTRTITADDLVVDDAEPARTFNVRSALDMDGRRRFLLLQLELGVAT